MAALMSGSGSGKAEDLQAEMAKSSSNESEHSFPPFSEELRGVDEAEGPDKAEEPDKLVCLQGIVDEARLSSERSELFALDLEMGDIRILHGKERSYLYSTHSMSDSYANWAFLSQENDAARTLVECAREESRIYPRPMLARSLENPPFNLSAEAVAEAFEQVVASGAFPDIQTTSASNGDVYYFSTEHLTPSYARSLAEYYSVERPFAD
jgi:hypothetical protein